MTAPLRGLVLLALLAGVLLPSPARGAPLLEGPVAVEAVLESPGRVWPGDRVRVRLAVTHPAGVALRFPDAADLEPAGLEVLAVEPGSSSVSGPDHVVAVMDYTLAGFRPRAYALLPAMLQVHYELGGTRGVAMPAQPVHLVVESVLTGLPDPSLRPIRPPVGLPHPLLGSAGSTAAVLAAVGGGLLLLLMLLRRLRQPAPPLSPGERARRALAAAGLLLERPSPDYRGFYGAVAGALRIYLTERTGLPARSSTTGQMARRLSSNGHHGLPAEAILRLLRESDMTRWAQRPGGREVAETALSDAYRVIELVDAGPQPAAVDLAGPAGSHRLGAVP